MSDKIYVIQCRDTKMYYHRLCELSFKFVPDIGQATHMDSEDMLETCGYLQQVGISIIGWVDNEVIA